MIKIGIDQSLTCTGMCVFEDGELVFDITVESEPNNDDPLDLFHRCAQIAEFVKNVATFNFATHATIEGLSYGSVSSSTRKLATLQAYIVDRLLKKGIEVDIVAPTAMKKFATGKGNAKKEELFEALPDPVREKFAAEYKKTKGRYDVTDAYFLGLYEED